MGDRAVAAGLSGDGRRRCLSAAGAGGDITPLYAYYWSVNALTTDEAKKAAAFKFIGYISSFPDRWLTEASFIQPKAGWESTEAAQALPFFEVWSSEMLKGQFQPIVPASEQVDAIMKSTLESSLFSGRGSAGSARRRETADRGGDRQPVVASTRRAIESSWWVAGIVRRLTAARRTARNDDGTDHFLPIARDGVCNTEAAALSALLHAKAESVGLSRLPCPRLTFLRFSAIYPIARTFYLSAFSITASSTSRTTSVSRISADLRHDQRFQDSLFNSFKYVFSTYIPVWILALLLALALNMRIRARGFFRTIYFVPVVMSWVVVSVIWKLIFHRQGSDQHHVSRSARHLAEELADRSPTRAQTRS